jgi:threonine dehydrogenase-like Zn-dependent dehydrogenase
LNVLGVDSTGAMQSYWNVPAHLLHRIPDHLSFDQAALIEPVAVACHALRVSHPAAGEFGVVLGGGPIGALVAMVAKVHGLEIAVAEVNPFRIGLLRQAGLEVVDPATTDLVHFVNDRTGGAGADIVFECAGHPRTAVVMTELVRAHGLIEIVSLFAAPAPVNLHRFFARELRLCGTRVYTHEDFEEAIRLLAAHAQPFEKLITTVLPLEGLQEGLEAMEQGRDVMKVLIDCQA